MYTYFKRVTHVVLSTLTNQKELKSWRSRIPHCSSASRTADLEMFRGRPLTRILGLGGLGMAGWRRGCEGQFTWTWPVPLPLGLLGRALMGLGLAAWGGVVVVVCCMYI